MTQRVALPFFGLDPLPWSRPSLATFSTWLNRVDANGSEPRTATAVDGANGLPLVLTAGIDQAAPAGYVPTCLLKPAPTPPWTITAGVGGFSNANLGSFYLPIVLYDSGADKLSAFAWVQSSLITIWQYSNASNYNTVIVNDLLSNRFGFGFPGYFEFFRITNDGTTTTYYISPDNIGYKQIYSEPSNTFLGTITHVGFGNERSQGGSGSNALFSISTILWSWRET